MTMFRALLPLAALAALAVMPPTITAQTPAAPQATGRLIGKVLEEGSGAPVSGASVSLGDRRTVTALDGRYTFMGVSAGPVTVTVRAIGYQPKTVSGIQVTAGEVATQDVTLAASTVQVEGITVAAAVERGSVAAALEEQRTATNITNSVTAEQIARGPDSDAAQAMQRVSGVSIQDGRYVLVRGLGERYTTTSLNNARIPSPEPERKVVPLDLFPSNLLEAVSTSKTFTPDQPGDFSGASVDLRTREFDQGRMLSWSLSMGFNSAVTGRSLPSGPRVGSEWAAFGGSARDLPAELAAAGNLGGVTTAENQALILGLRNAWSAEAGSGAPNASMSLSIGGEDPVLGQLVGYLASFSYNYATDVRHDETRALGVSDGAGGARPQNEYRGITGTASVLWGGIVNVSTRLGSSTRLRFNNAYNRGADNSAIRAAGLNEEFSRDLDITRLSYVERSVRSNQLAGEHLLAGRHTLAWAVTSSGVTRSEPDRSDVAYDAAIDTTTGAVTPVQWSSLSSRGANRTFSELSETGWQLDASWQWSLRGNGGPSLKLGGQYRTTDRDADTRSYDLTNLALTSADLALAPEQLFALNTQLFMNANALAGRYQASDRLSAGYAQLDLPISRRLRLVGGARLERSEVEVVTVIADGTRTVANPVYTDVLPSLAANIDLGRSQQLRLSASQTLSRPEYRELSGVCYFEILGGLTSCGNASLQRALIRNADARWEWYPSGGEIISVGVFAKQFDQPIERILVASTGATTAGYVNADGATNYGLELELRKNLGFMGGWALPLNVSINTTLMVSDIQLGNDSISALQNSERPMLGQSPYVVNVGLGYTARSGRWNATLLYNVVGRRIYEVGQTGVPDAYEEERHVLDASARVDLSHRVAARLDLKNLLDAPYLFTQGSVVRHRYTVGRTMAVGFTWTP